MLHCGMRRKLPLCFEDVAIRQIWGGEEVRRRNGKKRERERERIGRGDRK